MSLKNAPCHPEHIRYAQCKLREGSCSPGTGMLRSAQHDKGEVLCLPDQVQVVGGAFESFAELGGGNFDEAVRTLG
jgi:hypothetical protein